MRTCNLPTVLLSCSLKEDASCTPRLYPCNTFGAYTFFITGNEKKQFLENKICYYYVLCMYYIPTSQRAGFFIKT